MTGRYVCIHGHFYQPPRENPWLGVIEVQDSAEPYHDWNERVTAECYRPNSRSRILDDQGWIEDIVNNYSRMSFNFGPTLLSWLEQSAPEVYAAILQADRESAARFGGHGSALAQPYNHVIMPLANSRDKRTQVLWGIADFEARFGRRPEGMWLPETAVDLESLEIMAEHGIAFTLLSPSQARRVRAVDSGDWADVSAGNIDTRRPYLVRLPSGRSIGAFFYDAPTSHAVAFEGLLTRGDTFAQRLLAIFRDDRGQEDAQLAHIASDGETYGHHHRFGDMALAFVLDHLEKTGAARLTNYGQYLELHPPAHEAEIIENTSWSCVHGLERWRSDCGCSSGGQSGWNQAWRKPLKEGLDWLRDQLAPAYESRGALLFKDPWSARDAYIELVRDRSSAKVASFLESHARGPLDEQGRIAALKLLEMQHHAMLMFTSCGWFFNDISGIETIQVLQYAGRAAQLAQEVFGDHLEQRFLAILAGAQSNRPEEGDGRAKLAVGLARVSSDLTTEHLLMSFGAINLGDQNISGGSMAFPGAREYNDMARELRQTFARGELTDVIHLLDRYFPGPPFSLRSLFRDEQRKVIRLILRPALEEAEAVYRSFYEEHIPLFRFLTHVDYPLPNRFHAAADFALNIELRRALQVDDLDAERVGVIIQEAKLAGIAIDLPAMSFELEQTIERLVARFLAQPGEAGGPRRLLAAVEVAGAAKLPVDLAPVQNAVYDVTRASPRAYAPASEAGRLIELLAGSLRVRLPAL